MQSVREMLTLAASRPDLLEIPEFREAYVELAQRVEANPLLAFEPHSDAQRKFIEAVTAIVAAFAGNRFGKTTSLVVCGLREALPREFLPPLLQRTKRFDDATAGWIVCPTEDKIFEPGGFKETVEKWAPREALFGGSWKKAFNGQYLTLRFECGSSLGFKTYKQDPSDLGSAALHWAGYDEPPPRRHREEVRMRLADHGGFEMFAMTPLQTNTGYARREIWKKREAPHITVVKGSIHDNPWLNKKAVDLILGDLSDLWRRAREFGDFVDVGGQIYPEFERCVVDEPWTPEYIQGLDHVCGIDPGIRNCGIAFEGFDPDNTCHIFDELLLQDATPREYAQGIRQVYQRWGVPLEQVHFVVDPAARSRGQTNAETVLAALAREGIYANPGQNDVQAGIGQGRIRMAHGRLKVSPECRRLRDEADEYAAKEPDEGRDDSHMEPVKSNDHILDGARYGWMERFWDPVMEQQAPDRMLGWVPGSAPSADLLVGPPREQAPMGFMS